MEELVHLCGNTPLEVKRQKCYQQNILNVSKEKALVL